LALDWVGPPLPHPIAFPRPAELFHHRLVTSRRPDGAPARDGALHPLLGTPRGYSEPLGPLIELDGFVQPEEQEVVVVGAGVVARVDLVPDDVSRLPRPVS